MVLVSQEKIDAYTAQGWWGRQTLGGLFLDNARAYPERLAVVDALDRQRFTDGPARRLSYAQLDEQVRRLCDVFLADGLEKDAIVVVQLPNGVEQFIVYLACARLGLIVSPVPVQYREHELDHVLHHTGAHAVVTCRRVGRHPHAQMFDALRGRHPRVARLYAWGDSASDDFPTGVEALDERLSRPASPDRLADHLAHTSIDANEVFTICWTSGTEAQPKGVPRSHNEWLILAPSIIEGSQLRRHCCVLNPFPLINMAGLSTAFASWLVLAGTIVQHHPFKLDVFLQQLREEGIHFTMAAPAVLNQLLQRPELLEGIDFTRLKTIGSGSAPLSEWMVQGFHERFGVDIVNHFGSNEGASLTCGPRDVPVPQARARYFPRAGVPGFDWHISTTRKIATRLVDPDTDEDIQGPGRVGELRYAGPTIFSGYYRAPELTARAFDERGYYRTGDLFEIDGPSDEYYRYVGRSKDVVIRGGMNISSEEVESQLLAHPKVHEAAIVGFADDVMGERACACVVPVHGQTVTLEELTTFLRDQQRMAAFKLPERLLLLTSLPRNPVGKILKRLLREQVATAAGDEAQATAPPGKGIRT